MEVGSAADQWACKRKSGSLGIWGEAWSSVPNQPPQLPRQHPPNTVAQNGKTLHAVVFWYLRRSICPLGSDDEKRCGERHRSVRGKLKVFPEFATSLPLQPQTFQHLDVFCTLL